MDVVFQPLSPAFCNQDSISQVLGLGRNAEQLSGTASRCPVIRNRDADSGAHRYNCSTPIHIRQKENVLGMHEDKN